MMQLNYKIKNLHQFTITVKVEQTKRLKLRIKIALFIIKIAMTVATLGVKFEVGECD